MDESLYAHLHQPILKILHSYGITKASSISVQVLSSVLDKYLASLVASCQDYANHAGRTNLRVNDVVESLEEMGTLLDDLKDYLEQEGGIMRTKDGPTVPTQDQSALSRYTNVTGVKKETELNEFKDLLHQGLTASEDRASIRLRYTRLSSPEVEQLEQAGLYDPMAYSDSEEDYSSSSEGRAAMAPPLSPLSESPKSTKDILMADSDSLTRDSHIPSFFPPFPIPITIEDGIGDESQEKKEELMREAELQKQKEAEQLEKEKEESGAVVVQSFPANYNVPAPYEVSKLQSRGTWHLPSISVSSIEETSSPLKTSNPSQTGPVLPYNRGSSTTEELLSALHALASTNPDPNQPNTPSAPITAVSSISTNPLRHKVSLVFLGTTPAKFNTPDTLFGLSAALGPTPRPANPLPTYVQQLEHQPGFGPNGKAAAKSKGKETDLPLPSSTGRSVGLAPGVVTAVTGTSSRIPLVGRAILAKPTLLRTKRLGPPPVQKRDEKLLLYHAPNPPLPAHWNMSVSGSASQYGGVATGDGKGRADKNPFGVAEATLGYTWDWGVKVPWEGLDRVKHGGNAPLAPVQGSTLSKEKSVPKISVNVPGRRQSTLSSITPVSTNSLVTRIPIVAERSPSYHSQQSTNTNMPPPPVPSTSIVAPKVPDVAKAPGEYTTGVKFEETEPGMLVDTPVDIPSGVPASGIRAEAMDVSPTSQGISEMAARATPLDLSRDQSSSKSNERTSDSKNTSLDSDIDAELAKAIGEDEGDDEDADIDADIAEALGDEKVSKTTVKQPSSSIPQLSNHRAASELEELLIGASNDENNMDVEHEPGADFDQLGVGQPPQPPDEGSEFIFSEMDYIPATKAGTLEFSSGASLPLATSSMRLTNHQPPSNVP